MVLGRILVLGHMLLGPPQFLGTLVLGRKVVRGPQGDAGSSWNTINMRDGDSETALLRAPKRTQLPLVEILLDNRPKYHEYLQPDTAVMGGLKRHKPVVRQLLARQGDFCWSCTFLTQSPTFT